MLDLTAAPVSVRPIAEIGITHLLASGIELGAAMQGSEWRAGTPGHDPIEIRHCVGESALECAPEVFRASDHASYHDAGNGRIAVRMTGLVPGVARIVLETVVAGRRYDVLYTHAPASPIPPNISEIPAYALALAARRAGVLAHGCGFIMPSGRAALCLGVSGAGKSTLARMMQSVAGVRVLNDDRLVLADRGNGMRMWSTPWPGRAGVARVGDAPLGALAIIGRADRFGVRELRSRELTTMLLQTLAVPVWSPEEAGSVLETIGLLRETIPAVLIEYPLAPGTGEWLLQTLETLALR